MDFILKRVCHGSGTTVRVSPYYFKQCLLVFVCRHSRALVKGTHSEKVSVSEGLARNGDFVEGSTEQAEGP